MTHCYACLPCNLFYLSLSSSHSLFLTSHSHRIIDAIKAKKEEKNKERKKIYVDVYGIVLLVVCLTERKQEQINRHEN